MQTGMKLFESYLMELPPGGRSGKHRHMGDEAHFIISGNGATEIDGKVSAAGDLAGAWMLLGKIDEARLVCDFVAATLSAEEAVRQELHRLRREGAAFVRESYGARK